MTHMDRIVGLALLASPALLAAQPRLEPLDSTLRAVAARTAPLAFSVVVVQGDRVVHRAAYGATYGERPRPVPMQGAYYIASATKSFTALTAALLASRRIVDLDAPITRYAPEFTLPAPLDAGAVTLRRLLSHRAGFESGPLAFRTAYVGDVPADSILALVGRTARPVDTTFTYTNTAYIVAARVLERATGTPWQDLVAREVLGPLGLTRTTARVSTLDPGQVVTGFVAGPGGHARFPTKPDALMHAAGGMVMSTDDAARWLRVQLNDGRLDGTQLLPAAVIRGTRAPLASQRGTFDSIERFGYALGWQVGRWDGDTLYHHFGNYPGAFAHFSFMPSRRVGVAVLMNSEMPAYGRAASEIARIAYDVVLERPGRASHRASYPDSLGAEVTRMFGIFRADGERRAARPAVPPRGWSAYAGTFAAPEMGRFEIVLDGLGAELRYGASRSRLEVLAGDTLRVAMPAGRGGAPGPVTFGADGQVETIVVSGALFRRVGATERDREERIREVVEGYFDGIVRRDSLLLRRVFHPDAVLMASLPAGFYRSAFEDWLGFTRRAAPSVDPTQYRNRIVSVDVSGNAALVKTELTWPGVRYVDYLSLLEVGGEWRIVAKTWHQERR